MPVRDECTPDEEVLEYFKGQPLSSLSDDEILWITLCENLLNRKGKPMFFKVETIMERYLDECKLAEAGQRQAKGRRQ